MEGREDWMVEEGQTAEEEIGEDLEVPVDSKEEMENLVDSTEVQVVMVVVVMLVGQMVEKTVVRVRFPRLQIPKLSRHTLC